MFKCKRYFSEASTVVAKTSNSIPNTAHNVATD